MDFRNEYEDDQYADAYSRLEFPGTYYLAFRDMPALLARHATGRNALDFGCGTGRSTRFLRQLGYNALGVDISAEMIRRAHALDTAGDYRLIPDADLSQFPDGAFDVILSAFTFDNIPTADRKIAIFRELRRVLAPIGPLLNLVSSPDIYTHEWASFSTKDFRENKAARCGDPVKIIVTALNDKRPMIDILWPDRDYRAVYRAADLNVLEMHKPLGKPEEPVAWVNETTIAPWVIYILARS